VHRLDLAAILRPKARRAEEHMNASSLECIPAVMRNGFAGRYFDNLIQNIVDFESLHAIAPSQGEPWLNRHVEYEGLEHLAQLKREKLPVIIAGFHFSATKLLAILLARRGFDVTQVWMPDGTMDRASLEKRLAEFASDTPAYGKISIIPDFSLPSYRNLLKLLRCGGTLIWFPDMFGAKEQFHGITPTPEWQQSATRLFDFSLIQTQLPQSKIDVPLCGQPVYLNPWIGGFARAAGAAVVPAALIRQGSRMRLILSPALRLPPNATAKHVDQLNRTLFEKLDEQLRQYPDQWFGWHSLCPVKELSAVNSQPSAKS